jgi:23S rRNA pseudouridine1911/1915/1917 synthase
MIAEHESRGFEYGVIHWRSKESGVLKTQLAQSLNLPENKLRELLNLGAIYSELGRMQRWDEFERTSPASTYLRLHTRPRRFAHPQNLISRVVFSGDDFLVVNKPSGIPCHATVDNQVENLLSYLSQELALPLYITHRLDVGTEGLLVYAKTKIFQSTFNQALQQGLVSKTYLTKVEGAPSWQPGDILTHWMKPSPRAPKELASTAYEGWARCQLKIISCLNSDVELELLTGRTHQIRAQLSFSGHPLAGDTLYGAKVSPETSLGDGFHLRSQSLRFDFNEKSWFFCL